MATVWSIIIPGGTLGTNGVYQFELWFRATQSSGSNKNFRINPSYGGSDFASVSIVAITGETYITRVLGALKANGATNSQKAWAVHYGASETNDWSGDSQLVTLSVDSTKDQTLSFRVRWDVSDASNDAEFIYGKITRTTQGKGETYQNKVLGISPGALTAYWPLNESSGNIAFDRSGNGYDGTYESGAVLGEDGIGDGETSVKVSSGAVDVMSAGFDSAWHRSEGTIMIWAKAVNSTMWSGANDNYLFHFRTDSSNEARIYNVGNSSGEVRWQHKRAGTASSNVQTGISSTDWQHFAFTFSASANEFKSYLNGSQVGVTDTFTGSWSGSLADAVLGSNYSSARNFDGWIAHAAVWDEPLTASQIQELASVD